MPAIFLSATQRERCGRYQNRGRSTISPEQSAVGLVGLGLAAPVTLLPMPD